MYHKLRPALQSSRAGSRLRVGELQVRERQAEVAGELALDAAARARRGRRSPFAPVEGRAGRASRRRGSRSSTRRRRANWSTSNGRELLLQRPTSASACWSRQPPIGSPARTCARRSPRASRLPRTAAICRSAAFASGTVRNGAAPISSATGATHSMELLDSVARGNRLAALEVEQLAGEPVADRPPHVLLEQAVRQDRQRLALVEGASAANGERVAERRERLSLGEVGLPVADADLDRRVREMGAHAPPDLRVLGDRSGAVEERDVVLPASASCRTRRGSRSAGTCA